MFPLVSAVPGDHLMITFEDRAVAFIDVLGFTTLTGLAVTDSGAFDELNRLVALLDATIPALNSLVSTAVPQNLIPTHIYISDCIILSAPLADRSNRLTNYNGLDIVVMRAIQVTHALLNSGFLVRGGIAIGKVWHSGSNIVGPAYMEAFSLEGTTSCPRILLSEKAKEYWKCGPCANSRMCIDYDGQFMVNGLHSDYVPPPYRNDPQNAYVHYDEIATANVNALGSSPAGSKWSWMKTYIGAECAQLNP